MRLVFRVCVAAAIALAGLTVVPASGAGPHRTRFALSFTSPHAASSTGMHVRVSIEDPSNPRGKAPQLVRAVVTLPKGTMVNTAAVPECTASNDDLMIRGSSACPGDTRVGSGTVEGDTGVGSPVDPITGDDDVFNGHRQIIEAVTAPSTPVVVAIDRLIQSGNRLRAHPPAPPGGPPDGKTHVRVIEFTIPARGVGHRAYITTPATCPSIGFWTAAATFTYADGVTERTTSTTPCRSPR